MPRTVTEFLPHSATGLLPNADCGVDLMPAAERGLRAQSALARVTSEALAAGRQKCSGEAGLCGSLRSGGAMTDG